VTDQASAAADSTTDSQDLDPQYAHIGFIPVDARMIHDLLQLPTDWRVLSITHDPLRSSINVFVQHDSIPTAERYAQCPTVTPLYRRDWDEDPSKARVSIVGFRIV
jgi:hypothetical protein